MASEADAFFESIERTQTVAYVATSAAVGMIIVIAIALIAAAIIIAFVSKRPGGYWMMSGVVAFAGWLGVNWYLFNHPFALLDSDIEVHALLLAAKYTPLFLYSIGLIRLSWSLRHRGEAASPQ